MNSLEERIAAAKQRVKELNYSIGFILGDDGEVPHGLDEVNREPLKVLLARLRKAQKIAELELLDRARN